MPPKIKDTGKNNQLNFIWGNFKRMFPEKVEHVMSYSRGGSKMIYLEMDDGMKLSFMYYTPTNWNLGTKPWRLKPTTNKDAKGGA